MTPASQQSVDALATSVAVLGDSEPGRILAHQLAKERLRLAIMGCQSCSLADTRTWGVPFTSPAGAFPIAVVGEAPGKDEDLTGLPFQGRSGKLLTTVLETVHLSRNVVHVVNTIACRPPNNSWDLAVAAGAPESCAAWFTAQLALTEAWLVVACGDKAITRMLGEHRGVGREVRAGGRWAGGYFVIPAWHPAYVLRQGTSGSGALDELVKAFKEAADIVLAYEYKPTAPSTRALEVVEYLGSEALRANTAKAAKAARNWWKRFGFIPVYSPVIDDDVLVTYDENVKIPTNMQGRVVFTIDELEKLAKLGDGGEMLRKVAAVKRVMGAEVVW